MYNRAKARLRRFYKNYKGAGLFVREFIKSPSTVGSVFPSSPLLTQRLIERISFDVKGLVVDLGAGTGVVTEQLLCSGCPIERIVAVERSTSLSEVLCKKWPALRIITDDATLALANLEKEKAHAPVHAVISSLPLRIFSKEAIKGIMERVLSLLDDDGYFIQYSYALWQQFPLKEYGFEPVGKKLVFRNMPPARIEFYKKAG